MKSKQENLREEVRFKILRILEHNPEISQRALAQEVGISTGGAHYVLNALVQKGLVKFGNFKSAKNKGRYTYLLTRRGISEKTKLLRKFLQRKREEYQALRSEIEELQAEMELGADMAPPLRKKSTTST